jgi:hypothetical protein
MRLLIMEFPPTFRHFLMITDKDDTRPTGELFTFLGLSTDSLQASYLTALSHVTNLAMAYF